MDAMRLAAVSRCARMTGRTLQRWLRAVAAVVVVLGLAGMRPAAAAPTDVDPSDLWWTSGESGWGMQLVKGGSAVFATLYVYDASGRPTFYTATLEASGMAWTGTLYESGGPYFGAPAFDAGTVTRRSVGTLSFAPQTDAAATLQYSVDGTVVNKSLQRLLLRYDDYSGHYAVTTHRVVTHCSDAAANSDTTVQEAVVIAQTGTSMTMEWSEARRTCTYSGGYSQAGRLGQASLAYACSDGETGNLSFDELTRNGPFIAGRFQGHAIPNACDYVGQFTGLIPN